MTVQQPEPISPSDRKPFWKRRRFRAIVAVVLLVVLAIVGRRFYGELDRLAAAPPRLIAAMAGLYVLTRVLNAVVVHAGLVRLGHKDVGRVETVFLLFIQYYTNMLVPRAGIGLPAGYLKVRHQVPIADFTAVQLLPLTLLMFACVGLIGLAGQGMAQALSGRPWDLKLAILFGVTLVGSTALMLVGTPAHRAGTGLISRFTVKLADAHRLLGRDIGLLTISAAAHLGVLFLRGWRLQLAFLAIGAPVSFWGALVASCASDVLFLLSLTPGAIGFREGAIVYAARVVGTTGDVAFSAAVLDRLVISATNVLFAQVGMWRYFRARQEAQDISATADDVAQADKVSGDRPPTVDHR